MQDVSTTFAYNAASQVRSRETMGEAYAYRGDFNVDRGYGSNGLNQYTSVAGGEVRHDLNGNLTRTAMALGTLTYSYDAENRLVRGDGAKTATMAYDPMDRLSEAAEGMETRRLK